MTALSVKVLADFAGQAIHLGMIPASRVITWADDLIASQAVPLPWLIDLSLVDVSDVLAVNACLRAVPGETDAAAVFNLIGALTLRGWRDGKLSSRQICSIGWNMRDRDASSTRPPAWGYVVDDAADCLSDGLITEQQFRNIISDELAIFEAALPDLPTWAVPAE